MESVMFMEVDTLIERTLLGITFLVWGFEGSSSSIGQYGADCPKIGFQCVFFSILLPLR